MANSNAELRGGVRARIIRRDSNRKATSDAVEWTEYPHIPPGEYAAYCAWAGQYRDRAFRRWTCLLRFDIFRSGVTEGIARLPMWLSLGNGKKPRASRRGKYLEEWVRANGSPPVRSDRLSRSVFLHRMCRVEVGETIHGPVPYSILKRILSWDTGTTDNSVSKSHSQEARAKRSQI